MEKELNIAENLKDKPQGTKLYDWLYNRDVELDTISTTDTETVVWCTNKTDNNTTCHRGYSEFGTVRGCPDGLQILLPSKVMRDWSKFAWKKGDVLVSNDGKREVLFKTWENDSYTKFVGFHCLITNDNEEVEYDNGTTVFNTNDFKGTEAEDAAQTYINTIEERLGGKFNRETLEIEKTQPEFKDGDVVFVRCEKYCFIEIFNYFKNGDLNDYASLNTTIQKIDIGGEYTIFKDEIAEIRLATDSEKKQLFEALAKEGKAWDAERKAIVDLKPKWTPKPFDRVITRLSDDAIWTANIFSHIDRHGKYVTIGCISGYHHCIPYNEETAKLIGTTNNWEG